MNLEKKKYDNKNILRTASVTISQTKNLGETLNRLLELVLDFVGGESGTVWLDGKGSSGLILATTHLRPLNGEARNFQGISEAFGDKYPLSQYPNLAFIVNQRQPLNIPDTRNWNGWFFEDDGLSNSWLGVPIQYGNDLYGVLGVSSRQTAAFEQEDEQLLEEIAGQIAILLENAKLSVLVDDANRKVGKLTSKLEESKVVLEKLEKELHDGPVQVVTALKLGLSLIYDELAEGSVQQRQKIEEFMSLTDEVMAHYYQHKQNIRKKI
jgi:GAF domain-containing protein